MVARWACSVFAVCCLLFVDDCFLRVAFLLVYALRVARCAIAACRLLFVVCCLFFRCLRFAVCRCSLIVVCCSWCIVCCLLFVV